jgi:two-component system, chemotaxis family, protein-glutamate methylesterase/glutaminase
MPKIRVLVVDDAVVLRKLITEALSKDPDIEVVGSAANGRIALQKIPQVNPDIITLDVEMPEMDGITTLREIRKTYAKLPVIMFSTLTARGAATTLDALSAGASDYVTKPANVGNVLEGISRMESELVPKIRAHCRHLLPDNMAPGIVSGPAKAPIRTPSPRTTDPNPSRTPEIVCIGTSTGGPNALAELFRGFPKTFPVPIVMVQHMPPLFTKMLAERLNTLGTLRFHEGAEGQVIEPNNVYLAPGGHHMEIRRQGTRTILHLTDEPPENSCRPAVDVLFRSVVSTYGGNVLGVVLTGMGQDGLRGCELIKEKHGQVVVQDEASSVVWGMPGYVAQAGYADRVLPLNLIAQDLLRRVPTSQQNFVTA